MIVTLHRPHKARREHLQADCHCIKLAGWEGMGSVWCWCMESLKYSSGVIILSQSGSLLQCFFLSSQYHCKQIVMIENEAHCALMEKSMLRSTMKWWDAHCSGWESRHSVLRWRKIDSLKHKRQLDHGQYREKTTVRQNRCPLIFHDHLWGFHSESCIKFEIFYAEKSIYVLPVLSYVLIWLKRSYYANFQVHTFIGVRMLFYSRLIMWLDQIDIESYVIVLSYVFVAICWLKTMYFFLISVNIEFFSGVAASVDVFFLSYSYFCHTFVFEWLINMSPIYTALSGEHAPILCILCVKVLNVERGEIPLWLWFTPGVGTKFAVEESCCLCNWISWKRGARACCSDGIHSVITKPIFHSTK